MEYLVIVGQENGIYRARIPNFPGLTAEGATRDEAVRNVERAVQNYLAGFEITTIRVDVPVREARRYSTAQDVLRVAGKFKGDEAAMLQHIEEIYAERRRQREEVEREIDEEERKARGNDINGQGV
jgi:predicted RNase H-like HicB family nuclease